MCRDCRLTTTTTSTKDFDRRGDSDSRLFPEPKIGPGIVDPLLGKGEVESILFDLQITGNRILIAIEEWADARHCRRCLGGILCGTARIF